MSTYLHLQMWLYSQCFFSDKMCVSTTFPIFLTTSQTHCFSTQSLHVQFSVDLPKKHGRGGQSALRFARLRLEKRHNYLRKVAEMSVTMFITDNKPNIRGLVLCGSAEFKNDLAASDLFDGRLLKVCRVCKH